MLDGQSHSELVDQVTTLIGEGRLMNAVELLEAGIAEQPYNQQLRACWHYGLFPIKVERALGLLSSCRCVARLSDGMLGVNRAGAYFTARRDSRCAIGTHGRNQRSCDS